MKQVNLRSHAGYVWVVTTMDMVHFFYRSSREASFLVEMLDGFSGILVSDFFTGYDSLPCRQQKCLVHVVRDLDEDLVHNPFNEQFKSFAQDFGSLLRPTAHHRNCRSLWLDEASSGKAQTGRGPVSQIDSRVEVRVRAR